MTSQSNIYPSGRTGAQGQGLAPSTVLCNGQYVIDQFINAGGFGMTYLARDSLDRKVVIKECFPNSICCRDGEQVLLITQAHENDFQRAVDLFQKEARALARLQHPNIVGVHQIFEANGTAYMALDFVEGTDLLDVLEQSPAYLSPHVVQSLALTLLKALRYVHKNGILHRDISPDNILLDTNGMPVLIDFGAARQSATQVSRVLSRVYTVKDGYSPPEFYLSNTEQSHSSDLYSLAATFVHLIQGESPPNSQLRLAAAAEGKPDPFEPLSGRFASFDATFLETIDTCMSLFGHERLRNAQEWISALSGPDGMPEKAQLYIPNEAQMERTIAELVRSTNKALERAAEQPSGPKKQSRPDPAAAAEAARIAAEREYWAILNEDPRDWQVEEDSAPEATNEPEDLDVTEPQEDEIETPEDDTTDQSEPSEKRPFLISAIFSRRERDEPPKQLKH